MGDYSSPSPEPESRVLIIMTGGTICMKKSPDGLVPARGFLQAGLAPRPSFNDGSDPGLIEVMVADDEIQLHRSLRTPFSIYHRQIRYAVFEFEELLDSSSIDAKGWDEIARTIERNYILFDAFVVLHGTDSLAYTSSALSFMLRNLGKPVILTGSQAPMLSLQSDATDNLLGSLVIAGHFMIPEVCLFFNYKLFRGNRATKVSSVDFDAFDSPNHPPLATITSMKTRVSWELIHRPTHIQRFTIRTNLDTHHVSCLRVFPGIRPAMVDAILRQPGIRGLVLETFGAGNAPGGPNSDMTKVLGDAVSRGVVIVNVTQCLKGSVNPVYATGMVLGRAGVVPGQDMTSEAALTKLAYLLSDPNATPESVARDMCLPIAGELTEHSQMVFQHPNSILPRRDTRLMELGYAVTRGDLKGVQDLLRGEPQWLLNEADYNGFTPLHVAATAPNLEILRYFLSQGASVHIRNKAGRTPLFLAANAGLIDHVKLLRRDGAHLHSDERHVAELHSSQRSDVWELAGIHDVHDGIKHH